MELNKDTMVEKEAVTGEKKVKEPSLTNALQGITPEVIEKLKLKDERAIQIATLLSEGLSKSEVLAVIATQEEESGVPEGKKPISHQIIYQIYKRLKEQEGVTVIQKELKTYRKKASDKVSEDAPKEAATSTEEFAEAGSEVVEG